MALKVILHASNLLLNIHFSTSGPKVTSLHVAHKNFLLLSNHLETKLRSYLKIRK